MDVLEHVKRSATKIIQTMEHFSSEDKLRKPSAFHLFEPFSLKITQS